jgi:hypothetical protein
MDNLYKHQQAKLEVERWEPTTASAFWRISLKISPYAHHYIRTWQTQCENYIILLNP